MSEGKPKTATKAADPGYTYLEAFDLLNFLNTNVPNTSSRCYANSTTQFLRMIPELYEALPPYAGEKPIGPLEFVRFMHRHLKITNPEKFRETYRSMLELTLGQCQIPQGQQDQSEFFFALIRKGERLVKRTAIPPSQESLYAELRARRANLDAALAAAPHDELLKFNSDTINENIRDIDKLRAAPGNKTIRGPLWVALRPYLMCKTLTRYTLDVANPVCRKSHDVTTEKDDEDEATVQLKVIEFENGTPIQQCFDTSKERTGLPVPIIQKLIHEPDEACRDIVMAYMDANRRRKINEKALETVRDIYTYDRVQQLKQESASLMDLTSKDAAVVEQEFTAEKANFMKSPKLVQKWVEFGKTPEYAEWVAKNPTKKSIEHPEFGKIAGEKMRKASKKYFKLLELEKIVKTEGKIELVAYLAKIETPEYLAELAQKRALKEALVAEARGLQEELLYPIEKSLIFREVKKYLLIHIGYEGGEASLTDKRFSGIMEPITLTMEDNSNRTYVPIAYVIHRGLTINSGHYFTYVYIDGSGWFLFDDENYRNDDTRARPVTPDEIMAVLMNAVPDSREPTKPTFILYRDAEAAPGAAPAVNLSSLDVPNNEEEEEEVNLSALTEEELLQYALAQSMKKGGLRRTRHQRIKKNRTTRRN